MPVEEEVLFEAKAVNEVDAQRERERERERELY